MNSSALSAAELDVLGGVVAFAGLSEQDIRLVATICDYVEYPAGSSLMMQGALEQHALILLSGMVEIAVTLEVGPVIVATLSRGALVGEIGMLCDSPRTATATALSYCEALVLSRTAVRTLVERSPGFALAIMQLLASRLEQNVQAISYFKATARAIQDGSFRSEVPSALASRDDEVGAFARTFTEMIKTVSEREERLTQEMKELRVEIDQVRKTRQVSEITDTPEFQALFERAVELRGRKTSR